MIAMHRLVVTCAVDEDLLEQVISSRQRVTAAASRDRSIVKALSGLCKRVRIVGVPRSGAVPDVLTGSDRPDVVFNLALSGLPMEAAFVDRLEREGLYFTGSCGAVLRSTCDKWQSRCASLKANISIPRASLLRRRSAFEPQALSELMIVKPRFGGASIGVTSRSVVRTPRGALARAQMLWDKMGVDAICEEFIAGLEYRIGFVQTGTRLKVAGIVEWRFGRDGEGFKSTGIRASHRIRKRKRITVAVVDQTPRHIRRAVRIARCAIKSHQIEGYGTVDLRCNSSRKLFVVDVNANPGIGASSHVWGPSLDSTLAGIVRAGLRRGESLTT